MEEKKCSVLECYSGAVAITSGGLFKCAKHAIDVASRFGVNSVKSLPGAKFPWDYPATKKCANCGNKTNEYLIARSGKCPKCYDTRREFEEIEQKRETIPLPTEFTKADVKYKEGL